MADISKSTKIGVISDSHLPEWGNLPISLLSELEQVDIIIHLGDICDLKTYKELQKIAPVIAVHGNMDDHDIRSLLPEKKKVEINGFNVGIVHGWGPPKDLEKRVLTAFKDVDLILFGHSHIPLFQKVGDVFLFNPGSTSMNRDGTTTYGILELGDSISHQIVRLDVENE